MSTTEIALRDTTNVNKFKHRTNSVGDLFIYRNKDMEDFDTARSFARLANDYLNSTKGKSITT